MFPLLYGRHVGAPPKGTTYDYLLHLQLNKFVWNTFPDNARMNNLTDLNVGEVVYISIMSSQLLDLMVTSLIFDSVTLQTSH